MHDADAATFGRVGAIGGGALFVAHGLIMMTTDRNLDAPPYALALIALRLVGLCASVRGGGGWQSQVGCTLAYTALGTALIQFAALLLLHWWEDPFWPVHSLDLALSLLFVLLTTVLLGLAALQGEHWRPAWRCVALVVGLLWLPLWIGGEWVGDQLSPERELSLGFVPTGLMWMVLGAALLVGRGPGGAGARGGY